MRRRTRVFTNPEILLVLPIIAVLLIWLGFYTKHLTEYKMPVIVLKCNEIDNGYVVKGESSTGDMWEFYTKDKYESGDYLTLIMDDNCTYDPYDDKVVDVKEGGGK